MQRIIGTCLALLALVPVLVGCGGGGSGSGVPTAAVTIGIDWAARSRAVNAPSSALSAVATLSGAGANGADITLTVNRNAGAAAYSQTYNFPEESKLGEQTLTIRFYAQANGGSSVVGTANTVVNVATNGGTVGTVTTTGTVETLTIAANQAVNAGAKQDLTVTARNAENAVVAISPGSIFYQVTNGGSNLRVTNGQVEGLLAGTASVTATVDGKTSSATEVKVAPVVLGLIQQEGAALYGTIRARVRGIGNAENPVSVAVGSHNSPSASIAFTDANAPGGTGGGAVDFRVPAGLGLGSQNIIVQVNGVASAAYTAQVTNANPFAIITLANGKKVVIELRRDKAPNTVDNFTGLALGTKTWTPTYKHVVNGQLVETAVGSASNAPFYDGLQFHRVTNINSGAPATKIIQGGDPLTKMASPPQDWDAGTGGPGFTIAFEANDLTHVDGSVGMARSASLNSGGSQFYICDGPEPDLNGNYVVFGMVIEGMENARAIQQNDRMTSVVITSRLALP